MDRWMDGWIDISIDVYVCIFISLSLSLYLSLSLSLYIYIYTHTCVFRLPLEVSVSPLSHGPAAAIFFFAMGATGLCHARALRGILYTARARATPAEKFLS